VTARTADEAADPPGRWRQLAVLAVGLLLAEAPWFTSAAVASSLRDEWAATGVELSFLVVAVQLGFAAGALGLAVVGAPDVIRGRWLFAAGAFVAAAANLGFAALATDVASALPFRAVTGAGIAACYPVAMNMTAGWFRAQRGLAIGVVIGALTAGVALPYLLGAFGLSAGLEWRPIVVLASLAATLGGLVVAVGGRAGPFDVPAPRFSSAVAATAFREAGVRLANLGYLGHMWELFGMWTWVPGFLAAALAVAGLSDPAQASLAAFLVVGSGAIGCVAAGALADRLGRTAVTIAAMGISGSAAIVAGFLYGAPALAVLLVTIVWGVTVVADSAQFSAAVSELSPPGSSGSALAVQTASGFALTSLTIIAIGAVDPSGVDGWRFGFWLLALGPIVGIAAMWRLRGRPEAVRMAGGRR
jgi:MFS family permease